MLKYIALLLFVDFPFSFGVQHLTKCLLGIPDVFVGALTVALTIVVNLCIGMFKIKRGDMK